MSFYENLRKKLEKAPDRNFDQRMMARMDLEFGQSSTPKRSPLRFLIPITGISFLLAFFVYHNVQDKNELLVNPMLGENMELIQEFELLDELDEDLIFASDEEWAQLMDGAGT